MSRDDGQRWTRVGGAEELRGPGPHAVAAGDTDLVLLRRGPRWLAFEGRCPHRGALLGEGELAGDHLVCRNHRWRFHAETGQREGGRECLRACPARERDGAIEVDASALSAPEADRRADVREIRDLPGPPRLPLVGSAHLLRPGAIHLQLEDWARRYGTPYTYRFGDRDVIVLSDMEEMTPILRERPEAFRRSSNLELVFEELGVSGVFSAEGRAWRPQRRLSMEALSHRHLRGFYPTLRQVAERLRERWTAAAQRGDVLDVAEELKRFTVDVTTRLVLGYDVNTLGALGDDVIQRKLELLFPAFNRRLFAIFPWWRWVRLPSDRAVDRSLADLSDWLRGLVGEARARLAADPARAEAPENFLEAMLVARDENGAPFGEKVILGNALTMLLAGEDTTAYTLAWAIHHLLDASEDVGRLRTELSARLGDAAVPLEIEAATELPFAGAVASETMRLRPVAPTFFLEPTVDTVVGGVRAPAGTFLVLLMRAPALDPESFHEPHAFRPQRWIAPVGAHDAAALQPFGSGPRICPGRTLALLEMKLVLATIFQSFEVERVGRSSDVHEVFSFTMMPKGLRVRLRARTAAGPLAAGPLAAGPLAAGSGAGEQAAR